MHVLTPRSLDDALELLAKTTQPLQPIAGGTDLMVHWHQQPKDDWHLLDLSRIKTLQKLELTDDALEIGALTTYWDLLSNCAACDAFPLLAHAARQVGAVQIQTRGTWAGNIANASPAADGVPVLMAYDATVRLQSVSGTEDVPLDHYFRGYKQSVRKPDQLIVGIRVPRRERRVEWFHKVGSRSAQAITKVGVALVRDRHGWRVVANSVAPYVCRCKHLEAVLTEGRPFSGPRAVREALLPDVAPIDDVRSTADYRLNVLSRLIYYYFVEHPDALAA